MFRSLVAIVALAAVGPLAACGAGPDAATREPAQAGVQPDPGFLSPPQASEVRVAGGEILLTGSAPAGGQVRLATPAGQAIAATADAAGRWTLRLPLGDPPQVYGLSTLSDGRRVQGQGYLLVAADGKAALLRSGVGAVRLDRIAGPAITAFDFDREGAAVVSGQAPPGSALSLRIDGRQLAEGAADAAGRFHLALPAPITRGSHRLQVVGDGFGLEARVEVSPAPALTPGPFRGRTTPGGVRADWITPGGGVQSTLILG